MSSWRGLSGRRYVVGVHALAEPDLAEIGDAVMIAVRRDGEGQAAVVDVSVPASNSPGRSRQGWLAAMRARGATELHVHRLAHGEAERRAILHDLKAAG